MLLTTSIYLYMSDKCTVLFPNPFVRYSTVKGIFNSLCCTMYLKTSSKLPLWLTWDKWLASPIRSLSYDGWIYGSVMYISWTFIFASTAFHCISQILKKKSHLIRYNILHDMTEFFPEIYKNMNGLVKFFLIKRLGLRNCSILDEFRW